MLSFDQAVAVNERLRTDQALLRRIDSGEYPIHGPDDVAPLWDLLRSRAVIFAPDGTPTLTRAGKARMNAVLPRFP